MAFQRRDDPFCWRAGWDVDGYFTKYFLFMPDVLFWGLAGFALYSRDIYVQLMCTSYWFTALVNVVLQYIVREAHPNPSCAQINVDVIGSYANPPWPIQLAAHYITLLTVDRLHWGIRFGLPDLIRILLFMVVLPFVLVFSGNYTTAQAFIGLGVGIATGLYTAQEILCFWMHRFSTMCSSSIVYRYMGYRHAGATQLYAGKQSVYQIQQQLKPAKTKKGYHVTDDPTHRRNNKILRWLF